jgi:hypothetical protein
MGKTIPMKYVGGGGGGIAKFELKNRYSIGVLTFLEGGRQYYDEI